MRGAPDARRVGMTTNDIQGNSWTDEPEIPNTKREGNKPAPSPAQQGQEQQSKEPASEQRPPSDS